MPKRIVAALATVVAVAVLVRAADAWVDDGLKRAWR